MGSAAQKSQISTTSSLSKCSKYRAPSHRNASDLLFIYGQFCLSQRLPLGSILGDPSPATSEPQFHPAPPATATQCCTFQGRAAALGRIFPSQGRAAVLGKVFPSQEGFPIPGRIFLSQGRFSHPREGFPIPGRISHPRKVFPSQGRFSLQSGIARSWLFTFPPFFLPILSSSSSPSDPCN